MRDDDDKGREQSFPSEEAEVEGLVDAPCPDCHGTRLNPTSRGVTFDGQAISEVARLSVGEARAWVDGAGSSTGRDAGIAPRRRHRDQRAGCEFLEEVGLGYLTLDRAAPTLSGGEAQRIRLAAQLGSNLQGVCYVLDEPTIGLHPRDNRILLDALQTLSDKGNTLVVVEHDEDTIRRADHIIDIGPGAGKRGGRAGGRRARRPTCRPQPSSVTGRLLAHPLQPPAAAAPRRWTPAAPALAAARRHAAQPAAAWTWRVPLHRLVAVTGVSGSGKSTLARDVLLANLQAVVQQPRRQADAGSGLRRHRRLAGSIDRVLEVDQTPIGKTPRSCPATYIGFWDAIRKLFTETLEAKARGYARGALLLQHRRRPLPAAAKGQGLRTIEMSFLPDVKVPCDVCHGQRFNPETLAVSWRGKSIGEVLQMEVDEAVEFFACMPAIAHPLQLLQGRGPGLPDAGPALAHAERRRGAAHQAGDRAEQGARRRRRAAARSRRTRCTCWTSRPWACTWPTWRS